MPDFQGSVRVDDDPASAVGAVVVVDRGRLVVTAAAQEIGNWPLAEVSITGLDREFHVQVEGEELIFITDDPEAFANAIGASEVAPSEVKERKRPKRKKKPVKAVAPKTAPRRVRERPDKQKPAKAPRPSLARRLSELPRKEQLAWAIGMAALLLGIFARPILVALLALAGSGALVFAAAGLLDQWVAARIPPPWNPPRLVGAGVAVLAVAIVLSVI